MAGSTFEEKWQPLVGPEGVACALKCAHAVMALMVVFLPITFAFGFAVNSGQTLLAVLLIVVEVLFFARCVTTRISFAAALTRRFDVKVPWFNVPTLRSDRFDNWHRVVIERHRSDASS